MARRKLIATTRLASLRNRILPPAFFLTDPARTPDPVSVVERLPRGWGVIYRHFGAATREAVARTLVLACRRRGLVLLIAADPDLARRVHADGVHWPRARLSGLRVRHPGWIETASAHTRADLVRAARARVEAVLLSSVFASDSPSAPPPLGALRFTRLAGFAPLPVYALGGVSADNAARAITRAAGWAAIGSVVDAWG